MARDLGFGDFTPAEKRRITALTARMVLPRANLTKLRRRVEEIEDAAMRRKNKK